MREKRTLIYTYIHKYIYYILYIYIYVCMYVLFTCILRNLSSIDFLVLLLCYVID